MPNSTLSPVDRSDTYCVIGAGPSGLAAIKNLLQRGIPVEGYEREDDSGGLWYYGRPSSNIYQSTHLISSKRRTEYSDYPMPKGYPPFPSHRQALEYLRNYAKEFKLSPHIHFNTSVSQIEPSGDQWIVTLDNGSPPLSYAGVIIANGHHWDALTPKLSGIFSGKTLHSKHYRTPSLFKGKDVLIVGAGNSGCDIAVEAAAHAKSATLSMRRGYHFLPKFLLGRPVDSCHLWMHRWGFPLWLQRKIAHWLASIAIGPPSRYGLPAPDHKLFETHPIINSQLLYHVGHGLLKIRPDIQKLEGDEIRFVDGASDRFDLLVYATGYRLSFPFLDQKYLSGYSFQPGRDLNIFHPAYDNLFFAGMVQPNGGLWGLTDEQCQLISSLILAQKKDPTLAEQFLRERRGTNSRARGIDYVESPRHALEVDYFHYRRKICKLLRQFRQLNP